MACLRAAFIGSISAWFPSRRSVESQRGAAVMVRAGHCRSGRSTAGNGRYRWQGIPDGRCAKVLMMLLLTRSPGIGRRSAPPRDEEPTLLGLAAAAKKQQAHHDRTRIAGQHSRAGRVGPGVPAEAESLG